MAATPAAVNQTFLFESPTDANSLVPHLPWLSTLAEPKSLPISVDFGVDVTRGAGQN
jgi:hypothetical protein